MVRARRLIEIASNVEPVQDGRIFIKLINGPFLFQDKGSAAEYGAGIKLALVKHLVDAVSTTGEHASVLPKMQRQLAQVVAIQGENIEGVELHFGIMLPAVQVLEIGDAIDAQQHSFSIDDELPGAKAAGGFDNQRIAIAPIVTVAGE